MGVIGVTNTICGLGGVVAVHKEAEKSHEVMTMRLWFVL